MLLIEFDPNRCHDVLFLLRANIKLWQESKLDVAVLVDPEANLAEALASSQVTTFSRSESSRRRCTH